MSGLERPENIMEIDMSLNRSLEELCDSYWEFKWEFKGSDEIRTEEEESEFGALEDYLEGMGFVSHLM